MGPKTQNLPSGETNPAEMNYQGFQARVLSFLTNTAAGMFDDQLVSKEPSSPDTARARVYLHFAPTTNPTQIGMIKQKIRGLVSEYEGESNEVKDTNAEYDNYVTFA